MNTPDGSPPQAQEEVAGQAASAALDSAPASRTIAAAALQPRAIAGAALLVAAGTLLPAAFGWAELPQPASALVGALVVTAGGLVAMSWRGTRARGLLIAALLLALFALPATGAAVSSGPGWFGSHSGIGSTGGESDASDGFGPFGDGDDGFGPFGDGDDGFGPFGNRDDGFGPFGDSDSSHTKNTGTTEDTTEDAS